MLVFTGKFLYGKFDFNLSIFDFVCLFIYFFLGEDVPAAMQRGCANANIDMSIVFYIVTLSMLLQQLNRITHGYGISYDVIRWLNSITPKTIASSFHCQQQQQQHQIRPDCSSLNPSDSYRTTANLITVNNCDSIRCIVRWKPNHHQYMTMDRLFW